MRPLYISIFSLFFAVVLSGCSELPDLKDPKSLSSRVGNYAPAKMDSDKAERRATKLVTPLPRGSKDLDGMQESFDPTFGSPESVPFGIAPPGKQLVGPVAGRPAVNQDVSGSPSAGPKTAASGQFSAQSGSQFGAPETSDPAASLSAKSRKPVIAAGAQPGLSQSQTFAQLSKGKDPAQGKALQNSAATTSKGTSSTPSVSSTAPSREQISSPILKNETVDSSSFGKSQNGRSTTFTEARSAKPISEIPPSLANGNPQGFGCPPAGMSSLNNSSSSAYSTAPFGARSPIGSIANAPITAPSSNQIRSADSTDNYQTRAYNAPTINNPLGANNGTSFNRPAGTDNARLFSNRSGTSTLSNLSSADNTRLFSNRSQTQATSSVHNPSGSDVRLFSNRSRTQNAPPFNPSGTDSPLAFNNQSRAYDVRSFEYPSRPFTSPPVTSQAARPFNIPLYGQSNLSATRADDSQVVNAQSQRSRSANVTITARVKELLPDDRKGNPHQRFLLALSNGTTVMVAHNISLAPYIPLQERSLVTISGEYIWNEQGGVIHYTHHSTNAQHRGGYILYNQQTYK